MRRMARVMPVDVQVAVAHEQIPAARHIEDWALAAHCAVSGAAPADTGRFALEVCIRLVGEEESRNLNFRYRGKNKPTNVLSVPADLDFPVAVGEADSGRPENAREKPDFWGTEDPLLGDIVICTAVVEDEAANQEKSFADHLAHMVVHGMLHLHGFDHEKSEQDMQEMEAMEREILGRLGVNDPYLEI